MDNIERILKSELEELSDEEVTDFLVEMVHCIELGYSTAEAYSLVTDLPWSGAGSEAIH